MTDERGYRNSDGRPCSEKVTDAELLAAVRRADSRAVNGEPHAETIASECALSPTQIRKRLRELERVGRVDLHESLKYQTSGTIKTVALNGGAVGAD